MTKRITFRAPAALLACALFASALAACGSEPRPSAEPAPVEPAPATAPAAPAGPVLLEPAAEPSPEQLPLPEDFSPQAEQEITADNFRAALDALEKEISADR